MTKKILLGLSDAEAGRVAGCSRIAIFNAKKEKRLACLKDNSVSPAALDKFINGRRAPRPVNLHTVNKSKLRNDAAPAAHYITYPNVPGPVVTIAVMAECFASDVVLALLPHLAKDAINPLYNRLLTQWRTDGAELADEDFDTPAGLTSWAAHPLFTRPVNLDWQELTTLAAPAGATSPLMEF